MVAAVPVLSEEALRVLTSIVGEEFVSAKTAEREHHAHDQSFHNAHLPAVVIFPERTEQVSAILRYANECEIPVTAWGAATSLEGNPIPLYGGIVLDLMRMDKILRVYDADFQVDVQPGIKYKDMNAKLAAHGLFFAPDPGANASIGGMIGNNAAGTRTPGYGATRDNVLRLEVVLANGQIIRTGTRSVKTSSGYDLVHLFIGSEGTLGVVTEATLKLAPIPEHFSAVVAAFDSVEDAARSVSAIMGAGLNPVALEFLDVATTRVLNTTGDFQLQEKPTLLMEFHSATPHAIEHELALAQELCMDNSCVAFEAGVGRAERDRLWKMRHSHYEVSVRSNPGISFLVGDVAVPVSKYPELVAACVRELDALGLRGGNMVGHAGDGNLHPLVPYLPNDEASHARAVNALSNMVHAALALGGTSTGEHGVGFGKIPFMAQEHGASLELMRTLKRALDPKGILNPGKMF
ncbi:MAG TPA: FAD-binding oxidoreductase [Anaerolineae bacterium]|nr:FAD-binding oxidoreductase [Anaerolineae bacterium]